VADHGAERNADVVALPSSGEILADIRGGGRWMRVTWHEEGEIVVLSLWQHAACVGTFRLDRSQVPDLVDALVTGLAGDPRGGQRPSG
jgi:hypothetical protein